ncbi:MAG: hypothetical protein R6W71_07915 [Bacteroidales bacterium]
MFNSFRSGYPKQFKNFSDHEFLVLGRMLKSSQDGIFSAGGFCGRCIISDTLRIEVQLHFSGYLDGGMPCPDFKPYKSQIGLQGMLYSFFDMISPFSKATNLFILRSMNALLLALMITLLIYWFYLEGGLLAALMVFLAAILSPWLTYIGRNMWFVLWVSFLPLIVMSFGLRQAGMTGRPRHSMVILFTSLAMLFNFYLHGYEWAITTMVMAAVPVFFYWQKDGWRMLELFRRLVALTIGIIAGLVVTMSIVAFQISTLTGKFSDGIGHIIYSFAKRSYGGIENLPDKLIPAVQSNVFELIHSYLSAIAFLTPGFILNIIPSCPGSVSFYQIIALFLVITLFIVLKGKPLRFREGSLKKLTTFAIVTWLSILAPLSWIFIFKGHSYMHLFMNPVTWFMPFCLFGFGLTGLTIQSLKMRKSEDATAKLQKP